jgi:hypothetical protein
MEMIMLVDVQFRRRLDPTMQQDNHALISRLCDIIRARIDEKFGHQSQYKIVAIDCARYGHGWMSVEREKACQKVYGKLENK